jgi:hypothetical protein
MTRDEALLQALAELSILRKAVTWLMAHEAAKLDDPSVLLRAASERITQEIGRLPPEEAGTVQEGFDRLIAEALAQAKEHKSDPPTS